MADMFWVDFGKRHFLFLLELSTDGGFRTADGLRHVQIVPIKTDHRRLHGYTLLRPLGGCLHSDLAFVLAPI